MVRRYLYVSFEVDFGNSVLAKNMLAALRTGADVEHFAFDAGATTDTSVATGRAHRNIRRARSALAMRQALNKARHEDRTVIFQQVSPALFAAPFLGGLKSYIALDWTRKLYEPILNQRLSAPLTTRLHRSVFRRVAGVLAFTEAAQRSVVEDYGLAPKLVSRIPMPFDYERYSAAPERAGDVRLLFVGADLKRKGGDLLLDWFHRSRLDNVKLTMVTQSAVDNSEGVTVVRNRPGDNMAALYADHDLLVLPTRCDAYPQVLGEAACAGLGILTTSAALGAPEIVTQGWNGFVSSSTDQLCSELSALTKDRAKIEFYKRNSRRHMADRFTFGDTFQAVAAELERQR